MSEFPTAEQLLQKFGGVERIRDKIVAGFLSSSPRHLEEMEEAMSSNDPRALYVKMHTYKGSLGYFTQGELYQLVVKMEAMAKEERMTELGDILPPFLEQARALEAHLLPMVKS